MQQNLELIVNYIHEKKGVWVTPTPPVNGLQHALMAHMASVAKEYFDNKGK